MNREAFEAWKAWYSEAYTSFIPMHEGELTNLEQRLSFHTWCVASQAQQPTEEAISAAMSEGNKLGIKSTDAARIVAAYLLKSQAQQPNYKLNELAQIIMSDCGVSTINNDALFNRILDRLINASDLQIRPDVLCGGCKGIRSSDCPDCNGSGKMTDPRAQAQQESQWISVEERLPEGDVFVDVYIRSRSNTNFMQRETSVAFVSGKFKINRIFDCEYVSHWMPIPPAPEGGE